MQKFAGVFVTASDDFFCFFVLFWRLSDELALSEDPVARFTDTLIEIANQTIPKSHISKNKLPKVPWFDNVCKQAIEERKKA